MRLSQRYIPARQLPDKAVSLLDTTCARVAVSQHSTPAAVELSRHRIEALELELSILDREESIGVDVGSRRTTADDKLLASREDLDSLERRWTEERGLVDRVLALRLQLAGGEIASPAQADMRVSAMRELRDLQGDLEALQGETPLILTTVDAQSVATVVAEWTGIPVGRMVKNEIEAVLGLADTLERRIIGQRHALDTIARRVQTSRARLDNPSKPIGVFMLAGSSGVGKTETAVALAEALYGGEQNLITINMSEYQEAHTVSSLRGAPPGYVGYGEGGVLTEAVRRRPYSVVLLDEVEKAHPDVHEIFFQVFVKGWMEDGEGRVIDFRNTLILLTTNVGTELITRMCSRTERMPAPDAVATALREPLLRVFPPALLGRLVVIPYSPLSDSMLDSIIRLQLDRIATRIQSNQGVGLSYDDSVVKLVASRCIETESGGRMIDAILTNTLLPEVSAEFLRRMADGRSIGYVKVGVRAGEFEYAFG